MLNCSQKLFRWSLIPAVTKGCQKATLEFAMASKRMKMAWLAQGTRVPIERLKGAAANRMVLTEKEIKSVELYLGVRIADRIKSSVRRCHP